MHELMCFECISDSFSRFQCLKDFICTGRKNLVISEANHEFHVTILANIKFKQVLRTSIHPMKLFERDNMFRNFRLGIHTGAVHAQI